MENNLLDQVDKDNKDEQKKMWVKARWGVLIVCVIHLFISLAVLEANRNIDSRITVFPVFVNYWIASWYINSKIEKGKAEENLLMMGIKVAGVIFILQVVLGFILILYTQHQIVQIINR
jgi:hypothetical protein